MQHLQILHNCVIILLKSRPFYERQKRERMLKKNLLTGLAEIEPETYIVEKIKGIPAHLKITFFSALLFSLLVHGYGFSNKMLNEDSIFYLQNSMQYLYQLGRWFLLFLQFIRGFHVIPWVIGVFAILYLSLGTTLLVSVLEVKNKAHCVLISFLIVAFPAWANQFMYDFLADAYPAAMLLAVFAIYLTKKYRHGYLAGALSLMFSLALYQSFLSFAIGLSLIALIRYVLEERRDVPRIALYAGRYLLCGILGLLFYMVSVRVSLFITGGTLFTYQGMDNLGQIPLGELPQLIVGSYDTFFRSFYRSSPGVVDWLYVSTFLFALYALVFLLLVYLSVRILFDGRRYKQGATLLTLALCALALPLGLNITEITAPGGELHTLSTNAYVLVVVLLFVFLDIYQNRKKQGGKRPQFPLRCLILLVTLLISGNYMLQSGSFYFVQHMQYESTMAFYNRLLLRIEDTPGYEPGMPVAIIGTEPFPDMGFSDALDRERWQIVGFGGYRPIIGLGAQYKNILFFQNYLGVQLTPATAEQIERILASQEFLDMPLYPRHGSVAVIGDVLVVKLNER